MIVGAILLLLAALALVAAELVVPSHGVLTACAALVAVGSVIMAYYASPSLGIVFAIALLLISPIVLFYAIRIYPNTPVGKRVILNKPAPTDAFATESAKLQSLLGQTGTALTLLRPAGAVDFSGNRIDALSESEIIQPGTQVQAIRITGLKVIVKPLPA